MINSTLPFSIPDYIVTDPEGKNSVMQEHSELAREEQQLHLQTLQALNQVQYSPRTSTLMAILDYAAGQTER